MEKFLVTGGAGFIGSNICAKLVSEGCFVRVVDNLLTGKKSNLNSVIDKVEFIEADMGDEGVALAAMKDVDVVLHQGALPSVPRSVDDPAATHKHCVEATFTLLLAARDAGIKRFVYAASSSAYGDTPSLPKIETMVCQPLSPYAVGKLVGEYYCSVFYKVFGLETVSLRYFNVFGPQQDTTSQYAAAIPAFVTAVLNDKPPTIFGDGEQSRDFTYVDNVVDANLLAARAKRTAGEVVNVAGERRVSVLDIARHVNTALATDIGPVHTDPRPGDVRDSWADMTRARDLLGFSSGVSIDEGIGRTVQHFRSVVGAERDV